MIGRYRNDPVAHEHEDAGHKFPQRRYRRNIDGGDGNNRPVKESGMLVNPFCPFTQVHNRTYDDHQRQHHYHEDADLAQAAPDGAAQELHFGKKKNV